MKIGYQGRVLKADGTPESGPAQITFSLFADPTAAGTPIWTETQTIGLSDGFYSTFLGEVTALSTANFNAADRFLEISINGTVLTPRQRLGAVPYALIADRATTATTAVTATNLTGGTVSATSLTVGGTSLVDASGKFTSAAVANLTNDFLARTGNDYIKNGTTAQASASFNVAGTGAVGGNFNAGKVGVAMTGAPTVELDVNGNAKISGTLTVNGSIVGPGGTPITGGGTSSASITPMASYFACIPNTWAWTGTNKQTVTCAKTVTLTEDSIVLVTAEGHMYSGTANSSCFHFIDVDNDVGTGADPFGTDITKAAVAPVGTMSGNWKMSPTTRILDLPKGTHTFEDTFSGVGACYYNGMSMHAVVIPKSLGVTRASCSPATWSVTNATTNVGQAVCEQTLNLAVPSTVLAVATGQWKPTTNWVYGYNQVDNAPTGDPCGGVCSTTAAGTNQWVGAAHSYNTQPEAMQTIRAASVAAGSHKFGFHFFPSTTATVYGATQQLLVIPNSPNVDSGSCTPVWSKSSGVGTSVRCGTRVFLPRSSVVIAALSGHWSYATGSHGYAWIRADGTGPGGPDLYPGEQWLAPAYSNAANVWDTVSHVRIMPLSGGAHVLESVQGCIAGTCYMNGDSMHWVSLPN